MSVLCKPKEDTTRVEFDKSLHSTFVVCIWKYNMLYHFQEAHEEHEAPKLCEKEVERVLKAKYKH